MPQHMQEMYDYKVAEKFLSINGEGVKAGQLAVFLRFCGCNLNCGYCDTKWANEPDVSYTLMNTMELVEFALESGAENVTLTGGEPLLQPHIADLIIVLLRHGLFVEIETNGSVPILPVIEAVSNNVDKDLQEHLTFTMDYKLGCSGMESKMNLENFAYLQKKDTVKFVSGSISDLYTANEIIKKYNLTDRCHIYISPVFDAINPADIVEYMKQHKMTGVNLQLQLHKFIWNPQERGV
jgi:7-carboxy-7-deazaguanine synthase